MIKNRNKLIRCVTSLFGCRNKTRGDTLYSQRFCYNLSCKNLGFESKICPKSQ